MHLLSKDKITGNPMSISESACLHAYIHHVGEKPRRSVREDAVLSDMYLAH